jgi:hypothetical protein
MQENYRFDGQKQHESNNQNFDDYCDEEGEDDDEELYQNH